VLRLIETWLVWLKGGGFAVNPLREQEAPKLGLSLESEV